MVGKLQIHEGRALPGQPQHFTQRADWELASLETTAPDRGGDFGLRSGALSAVTGELHC